MSPVMNIVYLLEIVWLVCVSGEWVFKENVAEELKKHLQATPSTPSNASCEHDVVLGIAYADIEDQCETFHICLPNKEGKLVKYTYTCSKGTVFNDEIKSCVEKEKYECKGKNHKSRRVRRGLHPPSYSYHNLPVTNFTCLGKILGGYYADPQADCQMFHICTPGENNSVIDIMFLCGNGTVFDQRLLVCERYGLVDCEDSTSYLDEEERRLKEDEEHRKLAEVEITRIRSK